jgi:site-specific recombinase XerD
MILLSSARKKFIDSLKTKGRADATIIAYSKDIEQLVDYLERSNVLNAHEVSKGDIDNFLKHLSDANYTKKTISRKINAIKTFFKHLTDEKLIESDPAQYVQHPKLEQNAPRILSKIEYRALRDTVKDDTRTKAIVEILLQTGVRISELAAMKMAHVHLLENDAQSYLEIPGTRSTPGRTIPLNKAVKESIENFIKERPNSKIDNVFVTKTGNPLLVRNIRATLGRYFKQVGLENVTVNDLRHTFVAEHLRRGASVLLVSKVAGHKRLTTTENYLKYIERKESGIGELEEL